MELVLNFIVSVIGSIVGNLLTPYCRRFRSPSPPLVYFFVLTLVTWAGTGWACYIAFLHPREYHVEPGPVRFVSAVFVFGACVLTYAFVQMLKLGDAGYVRRLAASSSK